MRSLLHHPIRAVLGAVCLLALAACGDEDPTGPDGPKTSAADFQEAIDEGGTYEVVVPSESSEVVATDDEYNPDDQSIWRCTTERRSVVDAPEDYATFNPNAEVIYPGSLLQGSTLADATPEPIVVDRAGGTISIDIINGSSDVSREVDEVKRSTIAQASNDIIQANVGVVPAAFTYRSENIQSSQQMALAMGVNFSTLTTAVRANLSFSSEQEYNRFLVVFNQRFYTMSYDLPTSLDKLFASSVTPEELAPYVNDGNPATYISSVTYGRRFYLMIESTSSITEMSASIQGSYDAALTSGGGSFSGTYVTELNNVKVKIFALGGNANSATAAFNGNLDGLRDYLTDSDIRTGVPLSYVVRNVSDNTIVNVKVATDYDLKTCENVGGAILSSSFDTTTEGWSCTGDCYDFKWGNLSEFRYVGGYVWGKDGANGDTYYFRAPDKYHGDLTRFHAGTLSFALNHGAGTNGDPRVDGSYGGPLDDVIISGASKTLIFRIPQANWPVAAFFRLYEIPLDATVDWFVDSGGSRFEATDDDIQEVLENVTSVRVRGEYISGTDWCSIDEFELRAAIVDETEPEKLDLRWETVSERIAFGR